MQLVERSQALLEEGLKEDPALLDLSGPRDVADRALDIFAERERLREPAMVAMGNVAPLLAIGEDQERLQGNLESMVRLGDPCEGVAEAYAKGLINTFSALAHMERDEEALATVRLGFRLARIEPLLASRWDAAIQLLHQSLRYLGTQGGFLAGEELLAEIETLPDTVHAEVASSLARALSTWVILTVDGDDVLRAREGLLRLEALHDRLQTGSQEILAAVGLELAHAYSCLIEVMVYRRQENLETLVEPTEKLMALHHSRPDDRDLAKVVAVTSPAIMALHLCRGDAGGFEAFLKQLEGVERSHPTDEEIAFNIARGLVASGRYRTQVLDRSRSGLGAWLRALIGLTDAGDAVLALCRRYLEDQVRRLPDSGYLSVETGNFTRETGVPVSP